MQASPSPLPRELAPARKRYEPRATGSANQGDGALREWAGWYLRMRWVAIIAISLLCLLAVPILNVLPASVLSPLLGGIATLALSNLAFSRLLSRSSSPRTLIAAQVYVDLVVFAFLLHYSGGLENPVYVLPLLHVALAGVLLSRRQCYLVALAAVLLVAGVGVGEASGRLAHYPLTITDPLGDPLSLTEVAARVTLQSVLYFLVASLVTTLAERSASSERRIEKMFERVLAERQLLERALETTGTGLRVVDRECQNAWSNRRWNDWFPKAGLNGRAKTVRQTVQDGVLRVSEMTWTKHADESSAEPDQHTLQITTAPITDASGSVVQVAELVQEITDLKHAQAQMVRAGSMAAVGELAGQVAHEVNNPIAIISAKARLLIAGRRAEMSEKVTRELEKIVELSDRVAGIAQGLLSYCRPSPRTRTPLDLAAAARDAVALICERAESSKITIEDELGEALGPVVANSGEMGQVFLNLLLNALDAMPDGGTLRLSRLVAPPRLSDGRACVGVAITDTGPGVAEQLRERIWQPFFSTKTEGRGTGLGLSICLGLVNDHGGTIELQQRAGKGACFSVRLPLADATEVSRDGETQNLGG